MAEKSVGSGQWSGGRKGFKPVNGQPLTVNGGGGKARRQARRQDAGDCRQSKAVNRES